MSETRIWRFPFQYRIKCYDYWYFKIEKWFLGLRMVAWDIVSFVWDRERDRFAKAVGLKEEEC